MNVTFGNFVLVFLLIFSMGTTYAAEKQEQTKELEIINQELSLIEIFTLTNLFPEELIDLQNEIEELTDTTSISLQIPKLSSELEELEWETTMAISDTNLSFHDISALDTKLMKVTGRIGKLNNTIKSNVRSLEVLSREWLNKKELIEKIIQQTKVQPDLLDSLPTVDSLEKSIQKAQTLIQEQIRPNLLAGKKIGEIHIRLYVLNDTVQDKVRYMNEMGFQQTSPSMLSAKFYSRYDTKLLHQSWGSLRLFYTYQKGYFEDNFIGVLIFVVVIGLVTLFTRMSKRLVKGSSRWYPFTGRPFSTGVFITTTTAILAEALSVNISLPPNWLVFLRIPMIISAVFITGHLFIQTPSYRAICYFLALSLSLVLIFNAASLPPSLVEVFVLVSSLSCIIFSLRLFTQRSEIHAKRKLVVIELLLIFLPLSVTLAAIAGYERIAILVFDTVLLLIVFSLIVWLMQKMISGILELMLLQMPFQIIRQNAPNIVSEITPVLVCVHTIIWFLAALKILWVFPTLGAALTTIVSLQVNVFSHIITPTSIFLIVIAFYATFLASRGINAFLVQEVLPRYRVERGVQASITRLVHYGILTIGFFILMKLIGFKFGDIAIIGGALGVGIGFGLKEIVNNFVSGLILLFERPVKVGDVIVVGQDKGEVMSLGLRATTVQTFDNAEIVIPNAELITLPVTNWTLATKTVRVKIPVGVAYGTDLESVLQILLSCAERNPTVLTQPPSRALFLAFGNSSLDFELRVWISDFNDKLMVLSELNLDIDSEFQEAGIEIPFPQSDLHLRTIDGEAAEVLQQVAKKEPPGAS